MRPAVRTREEKITDAFRAELGPMSVDALARATGLTAGVTRKTLCAMERGGCVRRNGSGAWSLTAGAA